MFYPLGSEVLIFNETVATSSYLFESRPGTYLSYNLLCRGDLVYFNWQCGTSTQTKYNDSILATFRNNQNQQVYFETLRYCPYKSFIKMTGGTEDCWFANHFVPYKDLTTSQYPNNELYNIATSSLDYIINHLPVYTSSSSPMKTISTSSLKTIGSFLDENDIGKTSSIQGTDENGITYTIENKPNNLFNFVTAILVFALLTSALFIFFRQKKL